MGLFSWLFGADKKGEHMSMGAGAHQMQGASTPTAEMPHGSGMHHHSGSTSGTKVVTDPVCGMDVDPEKAAATSVFQGTTYHFCAPGCKKSFDENPAKFVQASKQGAHGAHGGCC